MKELILKKEFFGGILYDKKYKENLCIDKETYQILEMLDSNNSNYMNNIKYIEKNMEKNDILEVVRELIENGIISLNVERYKQDSVPENYLSAPFRVFYDITYKCNLRCKHCFTSSGVERTEELTTDEKLKLVEQLAELGVERVSIAGGEPFASKDIYKFVQKCNRENIDVSISTNATLLNDETIDKINNLEIKNITVSFDGGTEKSMDFIRGRGTYKKAIDGLKILNEKYNKPYSIKTTLMKNNIQEIEELIKLAIKYNCNTIKFNCVREDGRAVENKDDVILSQYEYIEVVKNIEKLRKKYETKIKIRAPLNIFACDDDYEFIPELGFGCFAGKESICIDPLGNVKPCSHYPKEFICGNVKKDNLKYIWNNSTILKQFREFEGNDTCNNCKEYDNCRGGCRYRCFKNGDINGIDPFCYLKSNLVNTNNKI